MNILNRQNIKHQMISFNTTNNNERRITRRSLFTL